MGSFVVSVHHRGCWFSFSKLCAVKDAKWLSGLVCDVTTSAAKNSNE